MKRIKIPVNKSFSGTEYRAMGHALYYLLNYKGTEKSVTYAYMAPPKAVDNLKKLCTDWLNAVELGDGNNLSPDVTMTLPPEVQEALASFLEENAPKTKKIKKKVKLLSSDEIPF